MSRTEQAVTRAVVEIPDEDRSNDLEELLGVLAHELRNPLASMQGCAQTLVARGEDLPREVQSGLAEVIGKHAARMDWLVRAVAAYGGVGSRVPDEIDLGQVVAEASNVGPAPVEAVDAGTIVADHTRLKLAVEAAILAFDGADAPVGFDPEGRTLEIHGPDLSRGGRSTWKLDLAQRLLDAEGFVFEREIGPEGVAVRIIFEGGADV